MLAAALGGKERVGVFMFVRVVGTRMGSGGAHVSSAGKSAQ